MISKRKLIHKNRRKRQRILNQFQSQPPMQYTLFQQLSSQKQQEREQAITFIANLTIVPLNIEQLLPLLLQNFKTSLADQSLFALSNLCELDSSLTKTLFKINMANAISYLNSLLHFRSFLWFMTTICDSIPQQFKYLLTIFQNSIKIQQLETNDLQIILQYFTRIKTNSLCSQFLQKIYYIFQQNNKLKIQALSATVLINHFGCFQIIFSSNKTKITEDSIKVSLLEHIAQCINNLNLSDEYKYNIQKYQVLINEDQQEQQFNQIDPKTYQKFIDAIQSVEVTLQTILNCLEFDWQQQNEEDQKNQRMEQQNLQFHPLKLHLLKYFQSRPQGLFRNSILPFAQGQTLAELSLRVLNYLSIPNKQTEIALCNHVMESIQHIIHNNEYTQFLSTLQVALQILVKYQFITNNKGLLINIGEKILRMQIQDKECWILLLEMYSINFNPQKLKVSREQNFQVGVILKKVISSMPPIALLEECKGQAIDTLFDVFCNQNYDDVFENLGFLSLLQQIAAFNQGSKKKFIKQILADIKRFVLYKHQMIKNKINH